MKLSKLVIASSNTGKIRELSEMLPPGIELVPQTDLDIPEVVEDGDTFVANAMAKAHNASRHSGLPAVADDSGLEVDALGGAPGIYSARYAGPGATDPENVEKLLRAMEGVPEPERTARFRCVVVLVRSECDTEPLVCEGTWEGSIQTEATGQSGFGYDPIFHVAGHGCSAAELGSAVKNRISHRARALNRLKEAITGSRGPEE